MNKIVFFMCCLSIINIFGVEEHSYIKTSLKEKNRQPINRETLTNCTDSINNLGKWLSHNVFKNSKTILMSKERSFISLLDQDIYLIRLVSETERRKKFFKIIIPHKNGRYLINESGDKYYLIKTPNEVCISSAENSSECANVLFSKVLKLSKPLEVSSSKEWSIIYKIFVSLNSMLEGRGIFKLRKSSSLPPKLNTCVDYLLKGERADVAYPLFRLFTKFDGYREFRNKTFEKFNFY